MKHCITKVHWCFGQVDWSGLMIWYALGGSLSSGNIKKGRLGKVRLAHTQTLFFIIPPIQYVSRLTDYFFHLFRWICFIVWLGSVNADVEIKSCLMQFVFLSYSSEGNYKHLFSALTVWERRDLLLTQLTITSLLFSAKDGMKHLCKKTQKTLNLWF